MLRLCSKLAFAITILCCVFVLTARTLGASQPPNPALTAFNIDCEGQPHPCWFGVVPGKTTWMEMNHLLAFAGEPEFNRTILARNDFSLIYTLPQPWPYCRASFYFTDTLLVRGEITLCREPHIRVGDLGLLPHNGDWILSLPPDELIYDHLATNVDGWPTPFSRVSFISLLPGDARFQQFRWHGFVSQWAYCQREPDYPRC